VLRSVPPDEAWGGATPACRNVLRRAGTGFSPWGSTCKGNNLSEDEQSSLLGRLPFASSAGILQEESDEQSPEKMTVGILTLEFLCPVNNSVG